ncbi:MAG: lipid II:glycine glycyltransferase FemX [Propionibacteriaceae bacterium]
MTITVVDISSSEHAAFVSEQPFVPYLQTPEWVTTKPANVATSLGIFVDGELQGVGTVQFLPATIGRTAYFPDGPYVRWDKVDADAVLAALEAELKLRGAISLRIGPFLPWRIFSQETLKAVLANPNDVNLRTLESDQTDSQITDLVRTMKKRNWVFSPENDGVGAQNIFNFFVDVSLPPEQIQAGFNQMYRRNIKKAEKAGLTVRQGSKKDLATFYELYQASGKREGFFVNTYSYFLDQFDAFGDNPQRCRVYLAELPDGEAIAAGVCIQNGDHVWYTMGGSSASHREVRAVNALQWQMMQSAHNYGAKTYNMGGIFPDVTEKTRGLLQFKVATGGYLVQSPDEYTKVLRRFPALVNDYATRIKALLKKVGGR